MTTTDDFDYGLINDDLSIRVAKIDHITNVILKQNEIENPFFIPLDNTKLSELSHKDLYTYFNRVLVLCTKNDVELTQTSHMLFNKILTKDNFQSLSQYFTLVSVSKNILRNFKHHCNAIIADKHVLELFSNNLKYEPQEIVILMPELRESSVTLYNSLYDSHYSLKLLPNTMSLINTYLNNYRVPIERNLLNMITMSKESEFWTDQYNCNFNLTNDFIARSFKYRTSNLNSELDMDNHQDIINKLILENETKLIDNKTQNNDYLNNLENINEDEQNNNISNLTKFVDIFNALESSKKRTYYAANKSSIELTHEQVTSLFNNIINQPNKDICDKDLYYTFNSFLVSKDYCHLVLNNIHVLKIMKNLIEKHKLLYKYLFSYAWLSMYTEECIFKTKTTKHNRFVFDINTAHELPTFPYSPDDIYQNPYLSVWPVAHNTLDPKNNCLSLYCIDGFMGYGVTNLNEFLTRFNIFTCGNSKINIFNDIDWSHCAISGSVMSACLQKRSPLYDYVSNNITTETGNWNAFFNNYYSGSDIDLMCDHASTFAFMDEVNNIIKSIKHNLSPTKDIKIDKEPIRTVLILVNKSYFVERLDHINMCTDMKLTPEQIEKAVLNNNESILSYFYKIYADAKYDASVIQRKTYKSENNPLYADYYKQADLDDMKIKIMDDNLDILDDHSVNNDSEIKFYVNSYKQKDLVPETNNKLLLKISESIKFKLRSPQLQRHIEIFKVKPQDFFSIVSKFHLPCVRAYLTKIKNKDGQLVWNVFCLPSCITAMQTGINLDLKYFVSLKNPHDIINKYRSRGFGVLLNSSEKSHHTYYNSSIHKSDGQFAVDKSDKKSIDKFYGAHDINCDFYKPMCFLQDFPKDSYMPRTLKYYKNINDVKDYYMAKHNYNSNTSSINMFNFKSISPNGNIEPLQKWVIDAYWQMVNKPL
jgi:hypothetical protein